VTEPLSAASGIADLLDAVENGRLIARTLDMATGAQRSGQPRPPTAWRSTARPC
jgi:xanthine dehydrogenase accessory factor